MKRTSSKAKYKPGNELFDIVVNNYFKKGLFSYSVVYKETKIPHSCYVSALSYYLKRLTDGCMKFEEDKNLPKSSYKDLLKYEN
ncbi:MAG TPA: hypothetical protein VMX17_16825 [Candidatus Glassbacteria bacterium]|nr:hypothetical protein [Candidatus Glassbacteria bacterium]